MFAWLTELPGRLRRELGQTFRSLKNRNFCIYSSGQLVSLTGTWMQNVALSWLTYNLTQSALLLALVGLCSNLPVLALSLAGGALADRADRRKVLLVTVSLEMVLAACLSFLFFTHHLTIGVVLFIAFIQGLITAFELPSRQAFVGDLVVGQDMVNAISLNSVIFNTTRMIGPAAGALLLAGYGEGICFALNAVSFLAAIFTLSQLRLAPAQARQKGQSSSLLEGLRHIKSDRTIKHLLLLTAFTSFFGFQFSFLIPVFVKTVFDSAPMALAVLTSSMAVGSLAGSIFLARTGKQEGLKRVIGIASIGVAITLLAFANSSNLWLSAILEFGIGMCVSIQLNGSNSLLQLTVPQHLKGRILSVYTMTLLGAVPFGSLVIGRLADIAGAPLSVTICAIACSVAALIFNVARRRG